MKKIISYLVLCFWIISSTIFISCETGKTKLPELDFVPDKDKQTGQMNMFVYDKKGNVFNGTAWSSDGKTYSIKVNNGILVSINAFYENGETAACASIQKGSWRYYKESLRYYNEDGEEISFEVFKANVNPELVTRIRMVIHEMGIKD